MRDEISKREASLRPIVVSFTVTQLIAASGTIFISGCLIYLVVRTNSKNKNIETIDTTAKYN